MSFLYIMSIFRNMKLFFDTSCLFSKMSLIVITCQYEKKLSYLFPNFCHFAQQMQGSYLLTCVVEIS